MGSCVSTQRANHGSENQNKVTKFTQKQLYLLKAMYSDLAKRCRNNMVSRETFEIFFHASGLMSEMLFTRFDAKNKGYITYQQLLQAFEIMMKGSLREKADILFELYDMQKKGGINYGELLKMLFSYPLEDLHTILVEEQFIKYLGEHQLSYYFGPEKKIEDIAIIEEKTEHEESQDDDSFPRRGKSVFVPSTEECITMQQKIREVVENDRKKKMAELPQIYKKSSNSTTSSINHKQKRGVSITQKEIRQNKKNMRIKSNISSLTKKYANFLFSSSNLNKEKNVFSKQLFFELLRKHQSIFDVYQSGFHQYIWTIQNDRPKFHYLHGWIENQAWEYRLGVRNDIYLKFVKTTIFVLENSKSTMPFQIINAEGLTVEKASEGFGIKFKHRDGFYEQKQYYFENESILDEWMRLLAEFKQNSIFDQYIKLERIGGGNFSNVFRGRDKPSKKEVAIKVIQKSKLSPHERQIIMRECGILMNCHHPNIVKFIHEYKTKTHIYIVTELLGEGDLFQYTKKNVFLEEYEAAIILRQLVDTFIYLNDQRGIIHRDLKPENVLVKMSEEKKIVKKVKLIDFGFAIYKDKLNDLPPKLKYAGTPGFIAPQVYNEEEFDEKIDTFSLGIILYFMLSGYLPFQSNFLEEIEEMTKNCCINLKNAHWQNVSQNAKDLIMKLLTFKQQRITTREVSEHSWLQNIEDLKAYQGRNRRKRQF